MNSTSMRPPGSCLMSKISSLFEAWASSMRWRKGLTPSSEFSQAVIPVEGMTVDAWVTELAWLTLGQEPTDQIRQAAYAFLGLAGYDLVPPALTPLAARMAAMMFNSHAYVVR